MKISVIIPTFNRKASLLKCLQHLQMQSFPKKDFEVIVVDDGSNRPSGPGPKNMTIPDRLTLTFLHQRHLGTAVARNKGIKIAKGDIILFIGDDIIAGRDLLKFHYQKHKDYPDNYAVLGGIGCPEKYVNDLFMHWLYFSGVLFDFTRLKDGGLASYRQFYTGNISLKRSYLLENGLFDEDFVFNFEDTELGYRLEKKGLKIVYAEHARVIHDHFITLEEFKQKMFVAGQSGYTFYKKCPELIGKIFPEKMVWQERLRLEFWHLLYPLGKLLKIKPILFNNYQRLVMDSILQGYQSAASL